MSMLNPPKIGLALGSGTARGWAHIGVLQQLDDMGITPHVICGTSIGALVGAAYVSGHLDDLKSFVCQLKRREIVRHMDLKLFSNGGFISFIHQKKWLRKQFGSPRVEDFSGSFMSIATDLETGQEHWFREGDLLDAVHASLAIPGLVTPVNIEGRWFVDGGVVNPVPVNACRALGADIVIAVSLNHGLVGKHLRSNSNYSIEEDPIVEVSEDEGQNILQQIKSNLKKNTDYLKSQLWSKQQDVPSVFDVMISSINIMEDRITRSRLVGDPPDIMLQPRLSQLGLLEFDRADEAISEGIACMQKHQEHILHAVQQYRR